MNGTASVPTPPRRNGGRILVDQLHVQGVTHAFCVPGESYLPVLDALYDHRDAIQLVVCRHEAAAANMAEAHGKLTNRPGICFVTRGPGATHASIGVHTAFQDSTPMILFIGQVGNDFVEREAFQEIDYRRMFGQLAKWVAQIDRADRIPEYVARAFQVATSGRMGPVVLALPEDCLSAEADVADARPAQAIAIAPPAAAIGRVAELLNAAERPFVIAGGSGWNAASVADLQAFAERQRLPVGCAFRFQDLFDHRHAHYAGDVGIGINPRLAQRVKDADVLIAIGPRLGEMTTGGYSLIESPTPRQRLAHIHAGIEELGRVYQGEVLINATPPAAMAALAALPRATRAAVEGQAAAAHADYLAWTAEKTVPGPVQMWRIMQWLNEHLPEDAILCNGAGNYATWLHRFFRFKGHRPNRTQLAPTSGAMGYGVPAAIAAKIVHPARTVLAFAGDGCFLMSGQEIATAVQYRANVIFIVVNNGMYGTIRMHQERTFPGRVHGTDLSNPDFAAFARSFGAHGETVERTEDFATAFERCAASGVPALIEIRLDPEALTPNASLSEIRATGVGRQ